jgi:hypothetical protein
MVWRRQGMTRMAAARWAWLGAVLATLMAAPAPAGEVQGLLRLDGALVKWGAPALGAAAEITYATLKGPRDFPGARTCTRMLPLARLAGPMHATTAEIDRELETALALWSAAARVSFRRIEDAALADIVIGAEAEPRGVAFAHVERAAASFAGVARIEQAAVCLDPKGPWALAQGGDPASFRLRRVLAHELGHAIGLDHYGRDGGVMGYGYADVAGEARLSAKDIAAVVRLYGPREAPLVAEGVARDAVGAGG